MLQPESQRHIEGFLKAVKQAQRSLLLLDYDGTLAPFRKERDLALPYPGVTELIQEIVRGGRTRVVIISGRDTSEIISLLGVAPMLEVWGLHGLQRRKLDGSVETLQLNERDRNSLAEADQWIDGHQLRHRAEVKTGSIAVHWRGVSEASAKDLRDTVMLGWTPIAERAGLELLDFNGGVEIRATKANKGDSVRLLLSEMEPETPAIYLGDDTTDERAFRAIHGRGLSVLVRPVWRSTAAQLWLKPPEELLDFLTQWKEAVREVHTQHEETTVTVSRL